MRLVSVTGEPAAVAKPQAPGTPLGSGGRPSGSAPAAVARAETS